MEYKGLFMDVRVMEIVGTLCAVVGMIVILAFLGMYGINGIFSELVIMAFCVLMGFLGIRLAKMES